MICFFVKETSENNKFKKKYKYLFNKLEINNNIIELPISKGQKTRNRKLEKIVKKLKDNNVRLVVLSKVLSEQEQLKNKMYSNDISILDGRFLFKILSQDIIEYICNKSKYEIQNIEISVLVNDLNSLNKSIILDLAEKVKALNIITNNISNFKDIENYLYNEKGIVINVSNNKKKSLTRSNIILNLDFCEEDVNTYNIPKNSIILNTTYPLKIKTKKFNGIIINNYNIIMPTIYKMEGFNDEIIYESIVYNLEYNQVRKQFREDKIKIKNLIGKKGIIQDIEFGKII